MDERASQSGQRRKSHRAGSLPPSTTPRGGNTRFLSNLGCGDGRSRRGSCGRVGLGLQRRTVEEAPGGFACCGLTRRAHGRHRQLITGCFRQIMVACRFRSRADGCDSPGVDVLPAVGHLRVDHGRLGVDAIDMVEDAGRSLRFRRCYSGRFTGSRHGCRCPCGPQIAY